jgi:hypothetical protein
MKLTYDDDVYYVIMTDPSGTRPACFWGDSPYGGLHTRNHINDAWRFDTRKGALREMKKFPDEKPAKVVRVKFETTATVYVRN